MHGRVWAPIVFVVLGCTELDQPAPITPESTILATCSTLTGFGGCPDGLVCSDGVCTAEQRPWCECGDELGCVAGDCVIIDESNRCSAERIWGACPGHQACVVGTCVPMSTDNACSPATPRGLCPAGAACDDGVCVPIESRPCSAAEPSGLCAPGRVCAGGECALEHCSDQAPTGACDGDQMCDAGRCVPLPCDPWHTRGSCGTGSFCSAAGACIVEGTCGADVDCAESQHCSSAGICLPHGECVADGDCGDGEACAVAGVCVATGACFDVRDCEPDELCGVLGQCLELGSCGASLDCVPGHACVSGRCAPTAVSCTTNELTRSGCNSYELVCCPAGEVCCGGRERCSEEGICIQRDQCLGDGDCLWGSVCVDYACEPLASCGAGCADDQECSAAGGCIPAGRCASDLDCPSDAVCTAGFECQVHPDAACAGCYGSVTRTVDAFPNVLLVVDRSSAMNECAVGTTAWWRVLRDGLAGVTEQYTDAVHLGLATFPAACPGASCDGACGGSCDNDCPLGSGVANTAAGQLDQPTALANAGLIQQTLAALAPGGERATGATLRAVAGAPASFGLADPERENVIVVITSGPAGLDEGVVDGCAPSDDDCKVERAIEALAALTPVVHTHVLTLGNGALADGEAIARAVEEVVRAHVPCTFDIPSSMGGLLVYADDGAGLASVAWDSENGWAFDEGGETFTLHGEACDRVHSGQVTPVLIGCHLCE